MKSSAFHRVTGVGAASNDVLRSDRQGRADEHDRVNEEHDSFDFLFTPVVH